MPHDVMTHWNSTYDMLNFALEYWNAINILMADQQNDLQAYELNDSEWIIMSQLSNVLKVSHIHSVDRFVINHHTGSQRHNSVPFTWNT
jgi:hypothetical protein